MASPRIDPDHTGRDGRRTDLALPRSQGGPGRLPQDLRHGEGSGRDDDADGLSIVERAYERYNRAVTAEGPLRALALDDTKFALGDSDNRWQWPTEVWDARSGKIRLTINITQQHCLQIINEIRQRKAAVKFSPVDSKADKRTAQILNGVVRNIHSASQSNLAHDNAVMHQVYGGLGYWRVVAEYESDRSFNQVIVIEPIMDPRSVRMDPAAVRPDRADALWCFVEEDWARERFEESFPDESPSSWVDSSANRDWWSKDTVRVANYYYRVDVADELWFVEIEGVGEVLRSDLSDEDRKALEPYVTERRKLQRQTWRKALIAGGADKPLEDEELPCEFLPVITCIGSELMVDGEVHRKGHVRDLKDPGRMVNYSYSESVHTLAVQNHSPYIGSHRAFKGHEVIWRSAARLNPTFLPYNDVDDEGNPINPPSRQMPPAFADAQVQMLQLSIDQARAASGQHAAAFGIKSEAQSGVGIQRLKVQGDNATYHYPDNFYRALNYEARVILSMLQRVYDTRRIMRVTNAAGDESTATLDPQLANAYQDVPKPGMPLRSVPAAAGASDEPTEAEIEQVFNPSVGRYDVSIDAGPSVQTQRQEGFSAMMEAAGRNPALWQIAGDIIVGMADFPEAEKLAKRIERALPPNLRDGGGGAEAQMQQMLQQATQQAQMAQQQLQRMGQELERLKLERAGKVIEAQASAANDAAELNVDQYRAETERMQALAPAIDPASIAAIVRQTINEILSASGAAAGGPAPAGPGMPMPGPDAPMPAFAPEAAMAAGPFAPEMGPPTGAQPGLPEGGSLQ